MTEQTTTLGKVEQVDIREIWPDEAADFTPWLAENLHVLGEALETDLELVEQEKAIGSFSLDILARDKKEDRLVAIENQLEWTDHTHLGQLLTYTMGSDAEATIWIATWIRPEHRAVIDGLNQLAKGKIWFFGVEVSVIKIGDSPPAPHFNLAVFPKDYWS